MTQHTTLAPSVVNTLRTLALAQSKHADYQSLHPTVAALFDGDVPRARGRQEAERWAVMQAATPMHGQRVWDIGANTGYFSMAALAAGAQQVLSQEGNGNHARFVAQCAQALGVQDRLAVQPGYCTFEPSPQRHDITLCLNVLHHLGDDFGDASLDQSAALAAMRQALQVLARQTRELWLQLGYNWKGDVRHPLFEGGTKAAQLAFVREACAGDWLPPQVWVFDPVSHRFAPPTERTMARLDGLGEFLNRPLLRLTSRHA